MNIERNKVVTLSFKFKKNGIYAQFTNAPIWVILNENDKKLLSGVATSNGNNWVATFSIPINYPISALEETLYFECSGFDDKNRSFSYTTDLILVTENEDNLPTGVVYSIISNSSLTDDIVLPYNTYDSFDITLKTPFDETILATSIASPTSSNLLSSGYKYSINLGQVQLNYLFNDPYLLIIAAKRSGSADHVEIHPVYILNSRTTIFTNSLSQYLNKARISEIDFNLQFNTSDYLHYLYEGIKILNAKDEATFWTLMDLPLSLQSYLFAASAWTALNARYLAEGQTSFEFQGQNTSLNFNRNEVFATKMQEMQSYLDSGLGPAKKSAINRQGKGTPPPGSTGQGKNLANIGILRVGGSLLTNSRSRASSRRRLI